MIKIKTEVNTEVEGIDIDFTYVNSERKYYKNKLQTNSFEVRKFNDTLYMKLGYSTWVKLSELESGLELAKKHKEYIQNDVLYDNKEEAENTKQEEVNE